MGRSRGVQPDGTIDLHGTLYLTVARRVAEFRLKHPIEDGWAITTKPEQITNEVVLFRAAIIDPDGVEVAVGYAEDKRSDKGIGATSALEKCETSAIGRALAAAGWGGTVVDLPPEVVQAATAEREAKAAAKRDREWRKAVGAFQARLKTLDLTLEQVHGYVKSRGWRPLGHMTVERREKLFGWLKTGNGADEVRAWAASQDPGDTPNDAQPDPAGEAS